MDSEAVDLAGVVASWGEAVSVMDVRTARRKADGTVAQASRRALDT
jgi:hypothetical protein